jgi:hypothetical protein
MSRVWCRVVLSLCVVSCGVVFGRVEAYRAVFGCVWLHSNFPCAAPTPSPASAAAPTHDWDGHLQAPVPSTTYIQTLGFDGWSGATGMMVMPRVADSGLSDTVP